MVKSKIVKEIADIIQYKPEVLLNLLKEIDPSVNDINAPVTTDQYRELTKLIKKKKQSTTKTQTFVSKKTEILKEKPVEAKKVEEKPKAKPRAETRSAPKKPKKESIVKKTSIKISA